MDAPDKSRFRFFEPEALAKWHSLCSLRKQITEPRALAALRFPCQIRLSRLAPAAHFEQSECHWALADYYTAKKLG